MLRKSLESTITMIAIMQKALIINKKHLRTRRNNVSRDSAGSVEWRRIMSKCENQWVFIKIAVYVIWTRFRSTIYERGFKSIRWRNCSNLFLQSVLIRSLITYLFVKMYLKSILSSTIWFRIQWCWMLMCLTRS